MVEGGGGGGGRGEGGNRDSRMKGVGMFIVFQILASETNNFYVRTGLFNVRLEN